MCKTDPGVVPSWEPLLLNRARHGLSESGGTLSCRPQNACQHRQVIRCMPREVGSLHVTARPPLSMINHAGDANIFPRGPWRATGANGVAERTVRTDRRVWRTHVRQSVLVERVAATGLSLLPRMTRYGHNSLPAEKVATPQLARHTSHPESPANALYQYVTLNRSPTCKAIGLVKTWTGLSQ